MKIKTLSIKIISCIIILILNLGYNYGKINENDHEIIIKKLLSFYSFEEIDSNLIAKNCFANVCTILKPQKNIDRKEFNEAILLYQIYFSGDFRYTKLVERLSHNKLSNILDKPSCRDSKNKEKCVLLDIVERSKIEYIFIRFDEGQKCRTKYHWDDILEHRVKPKYTVESKCTKHPVE